MCQNLADPPQAVEDVVSFVEAVHARTEHRMVFVEEAIGPDAPEGFKELRTRIDVPVCGGEIITTPKEMIDRLKNDVYDFVQPDASVMGGISAVMDVFAAAKARGTDVVVHAWGGAAAIMASYHAAFAAAGDLVEFPMLDFPLGREMMDDQARIVDGKTPAPDRARPRPDTDARNGGSLPIRRDRRLFLRTSRLWSAARQLLVCRLSDIRAAKWQVRGCCICHRFG